MYKLILFIIIIFICGQSLYGEPDYDSLITREIVVKDDVISIANEDESLNSIYDVVPSKVNTQSNMFDFDTCKSIVVRRGIEFLQKLNSLGSNDYFPIPESLHSTFRSSLLTDLHEALDDLEQVKRIGTIGGKYIDIMLINSRMVLESVERTGALSVEAMHSLIDEFNLVLAGVHVLPISESEINNHLNLTEIQAELFSNLDHNFDIGVDSTRIVSELERIFKSSNQLMVDVLITKIHFLVKSKSTIGVDVMLRHIKEGLVILQKRKPGQQFASVAPLPTLIMEHTQEPDARDERSTKGVSVSYRRLWTGGVIPVVGMDSLHSNEFRAMERWLKAGILFQPKTSAHSNGLQFTWRPLGDKTRYCTATYGMPLEPNKDATILCPVGVSAEVLTHELGHVIGLYHEQQRPDRDQFIIFHPDNLIDDDYASDYEIKNGPVPIKEYDYFSVMHYSAFQFGNGKPVLTRIDGSITLGSDGTPTQLDIEGVKKLYAAASDTDSPPLPPDVDPPSDGYFLPITLNIQGEPCYYEFNGPIPTSSSNKLEHGKQLRINKSVVVRFRIITDDGRYSPVVTRKYWERGSSEPADPPKEILNGVKLEPSGGLYKRPKNFIMITGDDKIDGHGKTLIAFNGNDPIKHGFEYTDPVWVYVSTSVNCIHVTDLYQSNLVTANFKIEQEDPLSPVVVYPPSGTYIKTTEVEFHKKSVGKIFYTLDGSMPNQFSNTAEDNHKLTLDKSTTINTVVIDEHTHRSSNVSSFRYIISNVVNEPTANPKSGTYSDSVRVTLAADSESQICYAVRPGIWSSPYKDMDTVLDRSACHSGPTLQYYSGPITISNPGDNTLIARANRGGVWSKYITTFTYRITSDPIAKPYIKFDRTNWDSVRIEIKPVYNSNEKSTLFYAASNPWGYTYKIYSTPFSIGPGSSVHTTYRIRAKEVDGKTKKEIESGEYTVYFDRSKQELSLKDSMNTIMSFNSWLP